MAFAEIKSLQIVGLTPHVISVEVDTSPGLFHFSIVGLPDKAVEEARDRMSSAIKHAGFTSPKQQNHKIVISLAPAEIRKEGSQYDLAMAIAYLTAVGECTPPKKSLFVGELSLQGEVRKIRGVLPMIKFAKDQGFKEIFVPFTNKAEAEIISGITVWGVRHLSDLITHLQMESEGDTPLQKIKSIKKRKTTIAPSIDFGDIRGQEMAKRGLLIAASGGHNIALFGPPGTGKSMLAKAFQGILPALSFDDAVEVTSIHSICGLTHEHLIDIPPLRAPHHTSSGASLTGGGTIPRPGEITLAHRGILFLDELPEFDRYAIEALRQPLEDRVIRVSRARGFAEFPADFILIATMNPCPCGMRGSAKRCICGEEAVRRYRKKISGPIIDRIDMWLEVSHIDYQALRKESAPRESRELQEKVIAVRKISQKRLQKLDSMFTLNAHIPGTKILEGTLPSEEALRVLTEASARLSLSARTFHRLLRIARTIADLDQKKEIGPEHILEALQYRPKAGM